MRRTLFTRRNPRLMNGPVPARNGPWRVGAVVVLLAGAVTGCSTIGVCDYDTEAGGWKPIANPGIDVNLHEPSGRVSWFANEDGDYMGCPEVKRGRYCSGLHHTYDRQDDGTFRFHAIVCTP